MSESNPRGTARDAWNEPAFRRVYVASFLSNAGRWMQTAAIGVLAWEISGSSAYLGAVIFAQLGPLGILSLIGGSLADTADRRKLLLATQAWQMAWTLVLGVLVLDGEISRGVLLLLVFIIGLGQGIYAPAFTSVLPSLAGARNLSAAIALNSAQINGARVIGPAVGGWLTSRFGFSEVFFINAATYVFVLAAVAITIIPASTAAARSFRDRIFGGFQIAFRAPQVGRPLLIMTMFSLFCLPFIGQLPAIAEVNLGIDARSSQYGYFYAMFGLGALAGAGLVAAVLIHLPRGRTVRWSLIGFGATLGWLALVERVEVAYVAVFCVGLFYFMLPTTLNTAWQEHVADPVRGRVAAVWVLSFGGTVPIGNIVAGPLVELTSLQFVIMSGAAAAFLLAALARQVSGPVVGEEILVGPP